MPIIFHITRPEDWARAETDGLYLPEAFQTDGFIHCSTHEQVVGVANARFRGCSGLALLVIDTEKVAAKIVYENLEGGSQLFPHIYGALNVDAVARIEEFEPDKDGYFSLPPEACKL